MKILNRRTLLKGIGAATALPWLEAMSPSAYAANTTTTPRRLMLINVSLGLYPESMIPTKTGTDYPLSEYLQPFESLRDKFTFISGINRPGAHDNEARIFTGSLPGEVNAWSLDQFASEKIGHATRFSNLNIGTATASPLSITRSGSPIPTETSIPRIYQQLFASDSSSSKENLRHSLKDRQGITHILHERAKSLKSTLSTADQQKLEEYFESIRDLENRLIKAESWIDRPKPAIEEPEPKEANVKRGEYTEKLRNLLDISRLAFQTDSTRIICCKFFAQNTVNIENVSDGYHNLSHHSRDPDKINQLKLIEKNTMKELHRFIAAMNDIQEGNGTLLDNTAILLTSNLGNGSNHNGDNIPNVIFGGRFKHGSHIQPPSDTSVNNIHLSLLHHLGIEVDSFNTHSTGTLTGLDLT